MPTFFIINGVKIELYYKDHNPPHFHAIIAENDALIQIKTLEILQGKLPKIKQKVILTWAKENEKTLMGIWNSLRDM